MITCSVCRTDNPAVARYCYHCGKPLAAGPTLEGASPSRSPRSFAEWIAAGAIAPAERRQVTMLACDIVGSTPMAESMGAEDFLDLVNRAFDTMLVPIFEYGGYLARLEGDGFKAFFGAPEAHEDDPLRAVRAGLAIQEHARALAEEFARRWGVTDFAVRVGINTGPVVVGRVGRGTDAEYTAMGIAMNLAARLESAARPGTVLISEDTYRLVAPYVEVEDLGLIQVKGKRDPVRAYEVRKLRLRPDQMYGPLHVHTPLVGRSVEMALLGEALRRLRQGEGGIVLVIGEAGMGKSRLIAEACRAQPADAAGFLCLEGRPYAEGQVVRGAMGDLLRRYVGIGDEDSPGDAWRKLYAAVGSRFPGQVEELAPFLGLLLGLPPEGGALERVTGLDPEATERGIFRALRLWLESLAQEYPLVLVLDDLQWADELSVRLLADLMALVEEVPLLLVLSFRPEREAACWQLRRLAQREHPDRTREIVLSGLSIEAAMEMIDYLLETESLPERIHRLILARSEGNPMFLEEVVRSLIEHGVLARSGDRWRVTGDVPASLIPASLHGAILARLDRLDRPTRRTLQLAAVIGRTFNVQVLEAISDAPEELPARLERLQRAEIIRLARRGEDPEYTFRHALTQQVAYDTLLVRQRRAIHRRIAAAIEQLYADRLAEHYERLAYHYAAAEAWPEALTYHLQVARQAQARFANTQAMEHYRRAWEILEQGRAGGDRERAQVREGQGDLAALFGRYAQAVQRYEEALQGVHEDLDRVRLLRKLGDVCARWGRYDEAIAYLERGLEIAQPLDSGREVARLLVALSQVYARRGDLERSIEQGERALEIFRRLDDRRGQAEAYNSLGIACWAKGDVDAAVSYHERSMLARASLGDIYGLAGSYNNLGAVYAARGEWEKALSHYRRARDLCRQIGYQHGLAAAYDNLGEVYRQMGRQQEALACLEKAVEIYARIGLSEQDIQTEMWKLKVW